MLLLYYWQYFLFGIILLLLTQSKNIDCFYYHNPSVNEMMFVISSSASALSKQTKTIQRYNNVVSSSLLRHHHPRQQHIAMESQYHHTGNYYQSPCNPLRTATTQPRESFVFRRQKKLMVAMMSSSPSSSSPSSSAPDYTATDNSDRNIDTNNSVNSITKSTIAEDYDNSDTANENDTSSEQVQIRKDLLHQYLMELNMDVDSFSTAVINSMENPIQGYDNRFGKSAIRAYRSFVFARNNNVRVELKSIAGQTARQIQFLCNRHKAHQMEWIRHHDATNSMMKSENPESSLQRRFPIILVLDNVRSALNVGNIFRTADATGCEAIYTVGITPHPGGNGSDKLQKSALGTEVTVPHRHFMSVKQAIEFIHTQKNAVTATGRDVDSASVDVSTDEVDDTDNSLPYIVLAMETTEKSISYTSYPYGDLSPSQRGIVLLLGNEVTGVDIDILQSKLVDAIIEIPMYGIKNSLNIAACAPIVIYEIIRQWQEQESQHHRLLPQKPID